MENIKNENKKSKLVFDARIARALCKKGFPIIDIKPLRGEPGKTVFVFANTEEFQTAFTQIMDEIKAKKESEPEQIMMDLD
jgi:biotin carboxylase